MMYADHLLEQAELLLTVDRTRPRQANLRRSVSSAYYALFHVLIDAACRQTLGTAASRSALRQVMARGFEHAAMKDASRSFAAGRLREWMRHVLEPFPIPLELVVVAGTFATLQRQRHRADYDLSRPFSRDEVGEVIAQAREALDLLDIVRDHDATRLYLVSLLAWRSLRDR